MGRHVALLRGINVGGKHVLPMAELRSLFVEAGAGNPTTYIQSGNVVFEANAKEVAAIGKRVEAAIVERFGFSSPVVLRSAIDLKQLGEAHPLAGENPDPKHLHVIFLKSRPKASAVAQLDPQRSPPDTFLVNGAHVYVSYPGGSARSKLTNDYFDRTLGVVSTMRNWRTVQKLIELSST